MKETIEIINDSINVRLDIKPLTVIIGEDEEVKSLTMDAISFMKFSLLVASSDYSGRLREILEKNIAYERVGSRCSTSMREFFERSKIFYSFEKCDGKQIKIEIIKGVVNILQLDECKYIESFESPRDDRPFNLFDCIKQYRGLIIDNIENNYHPERQVDMFEGLLNKVFDKPNSENFLVITTNSPYILNYLNTLRTENGRESRHPNLPFDDIAAYRITSYSDGINREESLRLVNQQLIDTDDFSDPILEMYED